MRLTKWTHSCVRLEDGERALVIDPGSFSEVDAALEGVDNVLITHQHDDHVDVPAVERAASRDSALRIWAPASVANMLGALGDRVTTVGPGESFTAGGFDVSTHGGQHALIHTSIPVVSNVGYLVGGLYHPGDSLEKPVADVEILLTPVHAPWSSIGQVIDFVTGVRPRRALNLHDGLLNDRGHALVGRLLGSAGERFGVEYTPLAPGEGVDL
jgi:L-ascorbate metabolism protein UlaG (beta-lactamase superfamily)